MAERRMFTQKIIDSDAFLDLPLSAQALYFHLNMRADDDGFINNPKRIQRMINASEDDLKLLLAKRFVLAFESGIIVIKHWRMHNIIRKDRYNPTQYQTEKEQLEIKENGAYTEAGNQLATNWQPNGNQLAPQVRLGKVRLGKVRLGEEREDAPAPAKIRLGIFNNVLMTEEEIQELINQFPDSYEEKIEHLSEYIKSKGAVYRDHFATIMKWAREDEAKEAQKTSQNTAARKLDEFYDMAGTWAQKEQEDTQ
jgi:hypothetical protein